MSSTIEFDRFIIKSGPDFSPFIFGFAELGESNVLDDKGRISRSLQLVQVNHYRDFMGRVIDISQDCEGGMLKLNGRNVKPEGYIGAWRKSVTQRSLDLVNYLRFANLEISFYSMVEQLESRQSQLRASGGGSSAHLAKGIDDLIIKTCTTEGIDETTDQPAWLKQPVRITRFSFTLENHEALLDVLTKAFSAGVDGRRIWNWSRHDGLNDSVWRRAWHNQCESKDRDAA